LKTPYRGFVVIDGSRTTYNDRVSEKILKNRSEFYHQVRALGHYIIKKQEAVEFVTVRRLPEILLFSAIILFKLLLRFNAFVSDTLPTHHEVRGRED
jgi:hypothetical protein